MDEQTPAAAPAAAPKKKLTLQAAIAAAAFAAGFGAGGTGVTGPIIVHGEAPADAEGWKCEVVGPPLNAQMVCRMEESGWPLPSESNSPGFPTEWREEVLDGGVKVMRPVFDDSESALDAGGN